MQRLYRKAKKSVRSDHAPLIIDSPGHPFDAGWVFDGFTNRRAYEEDSMTPG
jgi:hypothetical protein